MSHPPQDLSTRTAGWLAALEARHLADLRIAQVTPALRALSSAYVERRHKVASGATLDSAGKRAAFAMYYGPLHFMAAAHVLSQLDPGHPSHIVDLGCGTGVVGAAWALSAAANGASPTLAGIDRHPWAVEEARRTYRDLGLPGQARTGDLTRLPAARGSDAFVAGYVLNELPEALRQSVVDHLVQCASGGSRILIMEPIARGVAPWWDEVATRFAPLGGHASEWRFQPDVPTLVATLGKAAGLNFREVRLRTIFR